MAADSNAQTPSGSGERARLLAQIALTPFLAFCGLAFLHFLHQFEFFNLFQTLWQLLPLSLLEFLGGADRRFASVAPPGVFVFAYVVLLVPAWLAASYVLNVYFQRTSEADVKNVINDKVLASLTRQYRKRAIALRRITYLLIAIIFVILLIGFNIFQGAEDVTYRANQRQIEELETRLFFLDEEIQDLQREALGPSEDKALERRLERMRVERSSLESRIGRLIEQSDQPPLFWLSTLSTKAGSVLLLVFLVQILVTLYRYNLRLAFFYDSRADFLQLLGSPGLQPEMLNKIVSTDQFEFGKAPRTPVQQLAELARHLRAIRYGA